MDLITYLAQHGIPARREGDEIVALESYTINGIRGMQWVRIPATASAVRDWLGY